MTARDKRLAGVADRLRAARRERGLTQDGLAEASGVGVATIRRIEGVVAEPSSTPSSGSPRRWGVDMKWLAFGDDEKGAPHEST
jgi:transcriptional regulator with XRE-family HTH domain